MIRYLLHRHPQACCVVLFLAAMLGLRYLFVDIITTYGHAGFITIMAAIFGFAFWWERRHPTNAGSAGSDQ